MLHKNKRPISFSQNQTHHTQGQYLSELNLLK